MAGASGKKLDETYKLAWLRGLKTTYYLRTIGATHAEKSTTKAGALNAVSADISTAQAAGAAVPASSAVSAEAEGAACYLRPGDPGFDECEACQ
jgi:ribonucleoside-diphosphate reductase alpha chain